MKSMTLKINVFMMSIAMRLNNVKQEPHRKHIQ